MLQKYGILSLIEQQQKYQYEEKQLAILRFAAGLEFVP
jgi:hypothetical protein